MLWISVITRVCSFFNSPAYKADSGSKSAGLWVFEVRGQPDCPSLPSPPPRASCQAVNKAAAQPFLTTPPGESDLLCRLVKMFFLSLSLSAFLPLHHTSPPLVCYYHQPGTFDSYRGTRLSSRALGRSVSVKCSVLYPDVRCQKCVDVAVAWPWAPFGYCSANLSL